MNHQELIQALEQAQERLLNLAQAQSQVLGLMIALLQQERQDRFQQAVQEVLVENQELLQRLALVEAEEKVEVLEPPQIREVD